MYESRIKHLEAVVDSLDRQISVAEKTVRPDIAEVARLSQQRTIVVEQLRDLRRRQRDYHDEFGSNYDE